MKPEQAKHLLFIQSLAQRLYLAEPNSIDRPTDKQILMTIIRECRDALDELAPDGSLQLKSTILRDEISLKWAIAHGEPIPDTDARVEPYSLIVTQINQAKASIAS